MKKILLSTFFFLIALFHSFGQSTVPYSSFEVWYNLEGTLHPLGFTSSNFFYYLTDAFSGIFGNGVTTPAAVTRVTPGSVGAYAIKVSNVVSVYTEDGAVYDTVPGFFINTPNTASLNLNDLNQNTGTAFTARPNAIKAKYKFNQGSKHSTSKDTAVVVAWLTKWNELTQTRDSLGTAYFETTESKTAFTDLYVPFEYESNEIPDTIRVLVFSSINKPVSPATYIILDNITFDNTITSISTPVLYNGNTPQVYPNPTMGNSMIRDMPLDATKLRVVNSYGIEVYTAVFDTEAEITIPSLNFQNGLYIVNYLDANDNVLYNQKLVVKK